MERRVMTIEREELSAAARLLPSHVLQKRYVVVIAAVGLGPIAGAACAASPDQELVLLEALPKRCVVLIDVGQRLVPRLRPDDHVCVAHGCRPSKVQV